MPKKTIMRKSAGFSLLELLIAVIVLGILASIIASHFGILINLQRQDYRNQQRLLNQEIGMALLSFARYRTDHGTLPAPYTGGEGGLFNTVCGPGCGGVFDIDGDGAIGETDEARFAGLRQDLRRSAIGLRAVNHDDRGLPRVRVYQKAQDPGGAEWADMGAIPAENVPLFGRHGPSVTLRYDFGVVYTTDCPVGRETCRRNIQGRELPGDSERMVVSTGDSSQNTTGFTDWDAQGKDIAPFFVSTLPLQKQMLRITAERLNRVRDRLTNYYVSAQLAADVSTEDNLYPAPSSPNLQDAAVGGSDCRSAWYDLSSNEVDILTKIGLHTDREAEEEEYGVTAWGGSIWYCRDYYPEALDRICNSQNGTDTDSMACHINHAAVRIHRSVSEGGAPSTDNPSENLVLTL